MALIQLNSIKALPLVERLAKFLCYLDLKEKYKFQFEVKDESSPDSPIYIDDYRLELFWKDHLPKATMIVELIKEPDAFMATAGDEVKDTGLVSASGIWFAMVETALSGDRASNATK